MKLTATLAAVSQADPGPTQADRVFYSATRGGALSVSLELEVGQIDVGFRADLVLIDLTDPS